MLTLMKGQAGLTEGLRAEIAPFGVDSAERRAAVVAERFGGATTRYAELILHPPSLDNSAEKIVHSWLRARSSRRGLNRAPDYYQRRKRQENERHSVADIPGER